MPFVPGASRARGGRSRGHLVSLRHPGAAPALDRRERWLACGLHARRRGHRRTARRDLLEHAEAVSVRRRSCVGGRARPDSRTGSLCDRRTGPGVRHDVSPDVPDARGAVDDAAGAGVDAMGRSVVRRGRVRAVHVGLDEGSGVPAGPPGAGVAAGTDVAADGAMVAPADRCGAPAGRGIPARDEADDRSRPFRRVPELASGDRVRDASRRELSRVARMDRGMARRLRHRTAHRRAGDADGRAADASRAGEMEASRRAPAARPRLRAAHDGALRNHPAVSDRRDVGPGSGDLVARGRRLRRAMGDRPVSIDQRAVVRRPAVDPCGDVPAVPGHGAVAAQRVELTASAARTRSSCRR